MEKEKCTLTALKAVPGGFLGFDYSNFERYFRWKGLIDPPFFKSALKDWFSIIQSDSSAS
ncbi:hypothetical protein E2P30_01780 [Candidatus Bathyarchaeota archaeon]|nr:hypothetical protein E2P30_01780 [Candidatus Bathyarchaeota archaeon]